MDTSKKNIKMCEKAKEIQKEWHLNIGDYSASDNVSLFSKTLFLLTEIRFNEYNEYVHISLGNVSGMSCVDEKACRQTHIWLPTQDQLQEMIVNSTPIGLIKVMYNRVYGAVEPKLGFSYYGKFTSMEQLWLAFVMKEKYNKIWDGEGWKEEKKNEQKN